MRVRSRAERHSALRTARTGERAPRSRTGCAAYHRRVARTNRGELLRRSVAAGAVGAGALVTVRALLRPNASATRRLLDWEMVRVVATERTGERGAGATTKRAIELGNSYDAMANELAPLLVEVTEHQLETFPRFLAFDRRGFIDANIALLQRLLE